MTHHSDPAEFARLNPDPMMKTDRQGIPFYMNPAAAALFPDLGRRAPAHPLLADWRQVAEFLESCDDQVPFVRQVPVNNRVYEEHIFHAKDRSQFWMYINDVTEREQVERLKKEFLQNVCHELNTPLTCLCGCLQSLRDDLLPTMSEAQESFMQVAIRGAQHLADMVRDLGDSALVEQGRLRIEPRRFNPASLISDTAAVFARSQRGGCAIHTEIGAELPLVLADPIRIRQVLNNLISNARKFTPPEGSICVRARVPADSPGFLCVEVADTGCGIDPQDARGLFERLFQGKAPGKARNGLGIGLYLCRELVTRQGGRIWMESRQGRGTTFYFTLPVFSLAKLIEPLLERGPAAGFSLMTMRVLESERPIECRMKSEVLRAARETVAALLGQDEVLLPELSEEGREGALFLVSRRSPEAAVDLGRELALRLAAATEAFRLGLEHSVEVSPMPPPSGASGKERAQAGAAGLGIQIQKQLSGRNHECSSA